MASNAEGSDHPCDAQAGVSLVEIVIAMLLLALMSVAVLPLIFGAVQASAANRDLLAMLQASFPNSAVSSCAAVVATAATGIVDPSGSGATASITFGSCPSSYPATVIVTVRAFRPNSTTAVITMDSAILVSS